MVVCCAAGLALWGTAGKAETRADPAAEAQEDLLTLARGAVLVSASVDPGKALALIDGDDESNWSSSTRKPAPYVFVFELQAPAMLRRLGIDGAGARPGGVPGGSAGALRVEGSAEGRDGPWRPLVAFDAAEEGPTMVAVSEPGPWRWLRYSVLGPRDPAASWVYLDEVIAEGEMAFDEAPDRFSGVFQTGRKDSLELRQEGGEVSGCYVENAGRSAGRLEGAVVDGVALLSWRSDQGITGSAILTRDSTGAIAGVRYRQKSRSGWGGPPAPAGTVTPCSLPQAEAATSEPAAGDPIVSALEGEGVFRLYGIYFAHDSDVPKPSSLPALARLLAALQAAPHLRVAIEGHTDADGSDEYNRDLSERRAAAVRGWLEAHGIAADRLSSVGRGEALPVASNRTADGKALNRRVEVRRLP
ncbi:MAG: hypothetical protein Kow0058_18780 [Roseovarius sp.]